MSVESKQPVIGRERLPSALLDPAALREDRAHVLVAGPALAGKLTTGLGVLESVADGEAICVSTTTVPAQVRAAYEQRGGDPAALSIVDATAGPDATDGVNSVSTPGDLTGLGIAVAGAAADARPPVLIDSLSTLAMYNDPATVFRFADRVHTRTRDGAGVTVSTLNSDALAAEQRRQLLDLATVVLELRIDDGGARTVRVRDEDGCGEWHTLDD